jgi:polysaccharide pyruvyl transferase WcaK-like protein
LKHFVRAYDFVINAPQGPSIGDLYGITNDILRILAAARQVGARYGIAGVSMGPFTDPRDGEDLAFEVLRDAEGIILREDISLEHVRRRYPDLTNVQSAIDIVFSCPPPSRTDILPRIESHQDLLEWLDGETIGACISLTPARHPRNTFQPEEYAASFSALLDHVLEATQRRVLLFCHIKRDLPVLRRIIECSARSDRVRIFPPELDSSVQRGAIGQLGFFISSRYHPTIFAVESHTPFFCIKNQFKVEGMLAKLGLERLSSCWQDEDPAVQRRAFDESWARRDETRALLGPAARRATELGQVYPDQLRRWARAQAQEAPA